MEDGKGSVRLSTSPKSGLIVVVEVVKCEMVVEAGVEDSVNTCRGFRGGR